MAIKKNKKKNNRKPGPSTLREDTVTLNYSFIIRKRKKKRFEVKRRHAQQVATRPGTPPLTAARGCLDIFTYIPLHSTHSGNSSTQLGGESRAARSLLKKEKKKGGKGKKKDLGFFH